MKRSALSSATSRFLILTALVLLALPACSSGSSEQADTTQNAGVDQNTPVADTVTPLGCDSVTPVSGEPKLQAVKIIDGLGQLVDIRFAPGDSSRIYVVAQNKAVIYVISNGKSSQMVNLKSVIKTSGGEQGLLSFTFHPDFATNRKMYVYYTVSNNDTVLAELTADNPDRADAASLRPLLTVDQGGESNHNGGAVRFGPDGMLYLSTGDGGGGGDNHGEIGNAQRKDSLLGKILRLDVNGKENGKEYKIPAGNAVTLDSAFLPEIYHWGLRNPWRFSFDRQTGDMWIGDVGQNQWEELDFAPAGTAGLNFGWRCREGAHQYKDDAHCKDETLIDPVIDHNQSVGFRSLVAGYAYRGCKMPGYHGSVFYSDFYISDIHRLKWDGSALVPGSSGAILKVPGGSVSSFAEDHQGELYFVTGGGGVYKIAPE